MSIEQIVTAIMGPAGSAFVAIYFLRQFVSFQTTTLDRLISENKNDRKELLTVIKEERSGLLSEMKEDRAIFEKGIYKLDDRLRMLEQIIISEVERNKEFQKWIYPKNPQN